MLSFPASVRIFVAPGVTDMRKSFDGLAHLAREVLKQDPLSGHVFVFSNRRRDRVKILVWDRSGFWLFAKRLEKGTFPWPSPADVGESHRISSTDLGMILGGIDLKRAHRRKWFDKIAEREGA